MNQFNEIYVTGYISNLNYLLNNMKISKDAIELFSPKIETKQKFKLSFNSKQIVMKGESQFSEIIAFFEFFENNNLEFTCGDSKSPANSKEDIDNLERPIHLWFRAESGDYPEHKSVTRKGTWWRINNLYFSPDFEIINEKNITLSEWLYK